MKKSIKILLSVLSVLICLSLCMSFVGCNKSEGNEEEGVSGTAADSAADTETDTDGENGGGEENDPHVEVKETTVDLNARTKNVYMLKYSLLVYMLRKVQKLVWQKLVDSSITYAR